MVLECFAIPTKVGTLQTTHKLMRQSCQKCKITGMKDR
jgi:hypothetical protein